MPHRFPAASLRSHTTIGHLSILDEYPGPLGLDLWRLVRIVSLWATTPKERRANLFVTPARPLDEEIPFPAELWGAVHETPRATQPGRVAAAVADLARWAEAERKTATALALWEAAALAAPEVAEYARQVGYRARLGGEYARAEMWFRLAIEVAREARDWEVYVRAWIGLGNVYLQRGELEEAERAMRFAVRAGRRWRKREATACALHDLFAVLLHQGRLEEAEDAGFAAGRAYGRAHPNLPSLSNCIGCLLILRGHYARALRVLTAALPRIAEPQARLACLANLVRAAGVLGRGEVYREAWAEATCLLSGAPVQAAAATALQSMARGALAMGRKSEAMEALEWAAGLAERQGEARTLWELRALATEVERERETAVDEPSAEGDARLIRALGASCR